MLSLQDIRDIQADADKAITRQFRDAAEDEGWTPTETPDLDSGTHLVDDSVAPAKDAPTKASK